MTNISQIVHTNWDRLVGLIRRPSVWPVLIVIGFTFLSRFLGFVRQFFIYTRLDPLESDLLLSANKIPEQISVVLLMGTIYSSVLPIASQIEQKQADKGLARKRVSSYLNLINLSLSSVLLIVTIVLAIWMRPLLEIFSAELWAEAVNQSRQDEYVLTGRILLLLPLIFSMQAILGVFLTMKKRFLTYSLAGIISNLGSIIALATTQGNFVQVAIGMVVGRVVVNFMYIIDAFRQGLILPEFSTKEITESFQVVKEDFWKTWQLFAPRILIIDGLYVANLVINPLVQYPGQVTAFDVGTSIQGAFFVIVSSLATVLFPNLSELFYNEKVEKKVFWRHLFKYLKISIGLGFGVFLLNIIGSPLIMHLFALLGQGQGNDAYIVQIAQITGLSLVFRAIREILSRYLYVRQRQWQPVVLSVVSSIALIIISIGLSYYQWDAAIAVSVGLVGYNLVWAVIAMIILIKDRRVSQNQATAS